MAVPSGAPDLALGRHGAAVDPDLGAGRTAPRARAQGEVRDRRDARQRLAAKPERADRGQILGAGDLAGRMPLDRQARVLGVHTFAVVLHAQRLLAAELDGDRDSAGAGVKRVLDQFLHDRRRPLDDFAGGDLVGKMQGEAVDAGHDSVGVWSGSRRSRESQSSVGVPVSRATSCESIESI